MYNPKQTDPLFMNKILAFLFALLLTLTLSAQEDEYINSPLRLGFKAGLNSTSMIFCNKSPDAALSSSPKIGFYLGGSLYIPLSKNFIPFVELNCKNLNSEIAYKKTHSSNSESEFFAGDISLNYLSIGICPNVAFDIHHIKLNIYGGFHLSFPLFTIEKGICKKTSTDEQSGNQINVSTEVNSSNKNLTDDIDSGFLSGFGFEYKLTPKTALHFDTRLQFGTVLIANFFKSRSLGVSAGIVYDL